MDAQAAVVAKERRKAEALVPAGREKADLAAVCRGTTTDAGVSEDMARLCGHRIARPRAAIQASVSCIRPSPTSWLVPSNRIEPSYISVIAGLRSRISAYRRYSVAP